MKIPNLYPWIRSGTRYAGTGRPYVFWYRRIRNTSPPAPPHRRHRPSISFCVPPAHTYTYVRLDLSLAARKRWKSAFHEQAELAYYSYRADRISPSTRQSPRPLSPKSPLLASSSSFSSSSSSSSSSAFPTPLPRLGVSNLYRRCSRTPPATGQIIHYRARACTRHVARGEARPREIGKRHGRGEPAARRRFSAPE